MEWDEAIKYWDDASGKFAQGAKGTVHVFMTQTAATNVGSVWARVEEQILQNSGEIEIIIGHIID